VRASEQSAVVLRAVPQIRTRDEEPRGSECHEGVEPPRGPASQSFSRPSLDVGDLTALRLVGVPLGLEPSPTIVVKRALRLLSAFGA